MAGRMGHRRISLAKVELLYCRLVAHGGSGGTVQLVMVSVLDNWACIMASKPGSEGWTQSFARANWCMVLGLLHFDSVDKF